MVTWRNKNNQITKETEQRLELSHLASPPQAQGYPKGIDKFMLHLSEHLYTYSYVRLDMNNCRLSPRHTFRSTPTHPSMFLCLVMGKVCWASSLSSPF